MINKPFKVGRHRGDDDVSLFLLYEFVVHARLGDADLASEQIVEIAERLEEQEHVPVDGVESELSPTSSEDDTALTDLDKVVHAAVASAQTEAEADSNRER